MVLCSLALSKSHKEMEPVLGIASALRPWQEFKLTFALSLIQAGCQPQSARVINSFR